jgi:hypothetical protein
MLVTRFVIVWAGGRSGRDTLLFDDDVGLWSLRTASQTPPCPSATNGRPPSPSPPPHDFLQPYTQEKGSFVRNAKHAKGTYKGCGLAVETFLENKSEMCLFSPFVLMSV